MIVESANPAHSLADSQRMREALERARPARRDRHRDDRDGAARRLRAAGAVAVREVGGELLLLRVPDERLPAAPAGARRAAPACCPRARSTRASCARSGALDDVDLDGLRAAAERDRGEFAGDAVRPGRRATRSCAGSLPVIVHETLGPTLPEGAASAVVPVAAGARRRADDARLGAPRRLRGRGARARRGAVRGDPASASRASCSRVDDYDETWKRVANPDRQGRASSIPELLEELRAASRTSPRSRDAEFPFVLSAGERRAHTANTIYRDPGLAQDGRRRRAAHPSRRRRSGSASPTAAARASRPSAAASRPSSRSPTRCSPGYVTLPNGLGLAYPGEDGDERGPRRRAERADRLRGSRLARRHAAPQARPGAGRSGLNTAYEAGERHLELRPLGRVRASREAKFAASVESPTSANVTSPLPVTSGSTSYSTQVRAAIAPAFAVGCGSGGSGGSPT